MVSFVPMKHAFSSTALLILCLLVSGDALGSTQVSVNRVIVTGLEVRGLQCSIDNATVKPVVAPLMSALAKQKKALDACDPEGGAYAIGFKWKKGKQRASAVRKASNRKAKRCVAKLLKSINPGLNGSCRATLLIGKKEGAEKAAQAFKNPKK
jgi:hypothetical protein